MKYLLYPLALIGLIFFAEGIYSQINKKGAKSARLPCHNKAVVFERLYAPELLASSKEALLSGHYVLSSSVKKATFMKSKLFEYVNLKEVDTMVTEAIATKQHLKNVSDEKLYITYYIYENDKKDPGKKTPKSKLYAGYLHFTFEMNGKKIYINQSDFMDLQGKDISKSVQCVIESFLTLDESL
ncbi:MAG: hypothetical protein DRG24_08995 [Epsilonproteobacteria bacterium]|nr:MAG: hypothetical protein DRG24_08995 [Campylobacterota bacterium]